MAPLSATQKTDFEILLDSMMQLQKEFAQQAGKELAKSLCIDTEISDNLVEEFERIFNTEEHVSCKAKAMIRQDVYIAAVIRMKTVINQTLLILKERRKGEKNTEKKAE